VQPIDPHASKLAPLSPRLDIGRDQSKLGGAFFVRCISHAGSKQYSAQKRSIQYSAQKLNILPKSSVRIQGSTLIAA